MPTNKKTQTKGENKHAQFLRSLRLVKEKNMQKRLCLVRVPPSPSFILCQQKRELCISAISPMMMIQAWIACRVSISECVCVLHVSFFFFLNLDWGKRKERKGIIIKRDFDAQYFISVGVAPLADNVNLWVARPSFLYPVTALFIIIFFLTFFCFMNCWSFIFYIF